MDDLALTAERAACFFDVLARLEKLSRLAKGDDVTGLGCLANCSKNL